MTRSCPCNVWVIRPRAKCDGLRSGMCAGMRWRCEAATETETGTEGEDEGDGGKGREMWREKKERRGEGVVLIG